jgi:hypothetical protein
MANTPTNNKQNIIVGAAQLYIGNNSVNTTVAASQKPAFSAQSYRTTLEATPWSPASTDPTTGAFWKGTGYTQEGLEVSYEPDYGDVEVDQLLDSALVFKQAMKVSLNTTLAEATLYNLMVAWGQAATTLTSDASSAEIVLDGGSLGSAPFERSLIAVGNGVYGRAATDSAYSERVYHMFRVLNVEQSAHSMRRNENTGIPVSFRALPADDGTYGKIKDRQKTW